MGEPRGCEWFFQQRDTGFENAVMRERVVGVAGHEEDFGVGAQRLEIFGQLRVSAGASADVSADTFLLGSRGILTARTNSSLTINAPTANLEGQTRLEQGSSLTFAGSVDTIGPVTATP